MEVRACNRSSAFVATNLIEGNHIGTSADGRRAVGNRLNGIFLCGCTKYSGGVRRNIVGGGAPRMRNVISGNVGNGIYLCACSSSGGYASSNLIQGNFIGLTVDGSGALGNTRDGVSICDCGGGAHHNIVGSKSRSAGNVISHNGGNGVLIASVNSVIGNSIFANTSLGIGIGAGGMGVEAAPTITSVAVAGGSTTISGRVSSGTHRVEVFANTSCADPEGRTLIGLATTSSGSWSVTTGALVPGQGVTATATRSSTSKTSRFSSCRPA